MLLDWGITICDIEGMSQPPSIAELREAAGISQSYASMILSGARRPQRALAIHIFRKTGWRHPMIADLTAEQMDVLETVEPYRTQAA